MSDDLIERLRTTRLLSNRNQMALQAEAADLIERQAARIAELEIAAEVMKGNWQEGAVSL